MIKILLKCAMYLYLMCCFIYVHICIYVLILFTNFCMHLKNIFVIVKVERYINAITILPFLVNALSNILIYYYSYFVYCTLNIIKNIFLYYYIYSIKRKFLRYMTILIRSIYMQYITN